MYVHVSPYRGHKRVRLVKQEKVDGRLKTIFVKHIGTAANDEELEILKSIAEKERSKAIQANQLSFDLGQIQSGSLSTLGFYQLGAELVLGEIFDSFSISIGRLTPLLRLLTIARIIHPSSKRNTAIWIEETLGSSYSLDQIYRFLDVIYKNRTKIETSLRTHVATNYPEHLTYLIYDVTTLYFEIDHEDDENNRNLRTRGYSKDHRFDMPQIVLGLCVNRAGMPLSHSIYPGKTYEGITLVDGVEKAKNYLSTSQETRSIKNYENCDLTVVCDAGMLSAKNIAELKRRDMNFIISARLKHLDQLLTTELLNHDFSKNPIKEMNYKGDRLIVTYSKKRAQADRRRRANAISRLEKLILQNKAVRKHQFLDFSTKEKPKLDQQAIELASRFDGLKGYITNNQLLAPDEVISHYNQLPIVEQSFRMTKSDLKIRPSYHQRASRIESHVLLCMISLCVMRILEQKVKHCDLTIYGALDEINRTNSAVIGNGKKRYVIPPLYSDKFREILNAAKVR